MNLSQWRQIADRMAGMERTELRYRFRQELAKRQDRLLFLLHFDFARHVQRSAAAGRGNFFFGPADVNARLELLRQRLPEQVKGIIEQADKVLRHRFDLMGYNDLAYGRPIDWHLDLIHGKRAPRKVFYRVRYLDFEEVGDSKVTWELNRQQHFVILAKAYRLTGDPRYADEILRQWRHWRTENPYPIGINWASSLEVAFRSLAWLWTYHVLEGALGLPDFREEWLRLLGLHGRHLERYLSTYFSPNTHLLGEGVALFFLGVLCPELAAAERWKAGGWQIVLDEARRQVQSDGFHFEQSTYYHVYALDFFLHSAVLASVNNIPLPKEFEQSLEKMLTALCLLGRAGAPPRFGDDDGGRLFDPRRNRSENLLDPLATGAILFNRGDYKAAAGQLREETIWLVGPEGVRVWDELEARPHDPSSAALEAAGLYLLASEKPATQLVVDCGPMGTQSGGHGHADALSLTLTSQGRELLLDPGTSSYAAEGGERDLFRGTAMHNTVRVDGVDQAEPGTAFSWRRLTESKTQRWIQGRHFDLLAATHDGYGRLPQPVVHRRLVASLRNGLYLVRDRAEGSGPHKLEVTWHLGHEMQLVEEGLFRVRGASEGLALIPAAGHGWAQQVSKQSCSPVYGLKAPMTVLTFSRMADLPDSFCVLLVTLDEALRSPGTFAQIDERKPGSVVSAYRFAGEGRESVFFFGESGKRWQEGSVRSDAEFVCLCRWQNGSAQRLILVNGSHAEVNGGPALRFLRSVSWGEVTVEENRREIFTSDPAAVEEGPEVSVPGGPVAGDLL
ncbi:MAG TPA: alginate lyase family protein [Candidatus Sulfotelmatobacter sp.]|nr:alginate lyase family protein [Candidatus Sulfotelmatobacter sp.]